MDRFDAMQAFARVVETGSFTKAAETLHMSKTSVTQLVQQLEARLRVRLLNRTTRKVNVTADGAVYYERVLRLLADMDDAETSLSGAAAVPRGRLRVDVPSPLARMILVPALPDFHARFPDIQLDMGVSDRIVDVIGENVDCVVRGGELTDQSLVARRVGDLQLRVYAAPGYLQGAGTPAHPRELENSHHRIVGFLWSRSGKPLPYAMRRGDENLHVHGRYVVAMDDGNAYLAAGLAGMGVLWLPDYMAREHAARGELVPLFEDWRLDAMPLYLAYPPNRHVSAKLRVFIDWVVALMARHAPVAMPPPAAARPDRPRPAAAGRGAPRARKIKADIKAAPLQSIPPPRHFPAPAQTRQGSRCPRPLTAGSIRAPPGNHPDRVRRFPVRIPCRLPCNRRTSPTLAESSSLPPTRPGPPRRWTPRSATWPTWTCAAPPIAKPLAGPRPRSTPRSRPVSPPATCPTTTPPAWRAR